MQKSNWHIPLGAEYRRIENDDSIQFVSDEEGRVVYVSKLSVRNSDAGAEDQQPLPPVIEHDTSGFHLKGTKAHEGQVLVIVITFAKHADEAWALDLFDKIG